MPGVLFPSGTSVLDMLQKATEKSALPTPLPLVTAYVVQGLDGQSAANGRARSALCQHVRGRLSLFYVPLQCQEHALILLTKGGDDEGPSHFQKAMKLKREIAVHACHLFHLLKGMAKVDIDGSIHQALLHVHRLMERDAPRRIIRSDLALSDA